MPENKNQHFVPRFYLEHFSFDGGKRFHLFHIEERKLCLTAVGVASQCAPDNFYGRDLEIEKIFGALEGVAAQALAEIIRNAKMPVAGSDGDLVFRTHVAMQWGRTRSHMEEHRQMQENAVRLAFSDNNGVKTDFEKDFEATTREERVRLSIATNADLAPFIGDLESKLIDANGFGEFVTSDTPVVLINPYYLGRYPGGVTGLGVQGLVLLMPLSPRYLAIYYDKSYYRVGSPHVRTIQVQSAADVTALNNFQCFNADSAVYFQNQSFGLTLQTEYEKVKTLRPAERHGLRHAIAQGPNGPMEIIHSFRVDVPYRPQLSFFSFLRKRKGPREPMVENVPQRDEHLQQFYDEYLRLKQAGRWHGSFLAYLAKLGGAVPEVNTTTSAKAAHTAIQSLEALVRTRPPR